MTIEDFKTVWLVWLTLMQLATFYMLGRLMGIADVHSDALLRIINLL